MQSIKNIQSKLTFANIVSLIFHPLLVPSYFLLILFNSDTYYVFMPFVIKRMIFILIFLSSFLIPISIIPFFIHFNIITSVNMSNARERVLPFIISALSYFLSVYLLGKIHSMAFDFVRDFMISSAILIFICAITYVKWKISAHLLGIGGLMSAIYFYGINFVSDFSIILAILSVIAGITAFSRLKLQEHKPAQVYGGFLLGFFGMLLLLITLQLMAEGNFLSIFR